jgi:hypothetical protein
MPKKHTLKWANIKDAREFLIHLCTPKWTIDKNNPKGDVRMDDVMQVMSHCAGLLLEAMDQSIKDKYGKNNETQYSFGGDDTCFDYIPCAARNIKNILTLYLNHGIEPDFDGKEVESIKKEQVLKGENVYFQDEDMYDDNQMKIYREYSTMAGASWQEYDEMMEECYPKDEPIK